MAHSSNYVKGNCKIFSWNESNTALSFGIKWLWEKVASNPQHTLKRERANNRNKCTKETKKKLTKMLAMWVSDFHYFITSSCQRQIPQLKWTVGFYWQSKSLGSCLCMCCAGALLFALSWMFVKTPCIGGRWHFLWFLPFLVFCKKNFNIMPANI